MIYTELRRHQRLANKRHPLFELNRFAKILTFLVAAVWGCQLLFIGLFLPDMLTEIQPHVAACHLFNEGMVYLLAIDFIFRLTMVKIPAQEVTPYLLLPIKRRTLVRFFLIRSALHPYNLWWLLLLVPFSLSGVWPYYGVSGVIGFLVGYGLLFLLNNYWYLLCRTLINRRLVYALLPVMVYGSYIALDLYGLTAGAGAALVDFGEGLMCWHPLPYLGLAVAVGLLFQVAAVVQWRAVYDELARVKDTRLRHISEYRFLERWGDIGEYMRLEIRLCTRNKNMRLSLRNSLFFMVFFSVALSFFSVYDDAFMKVFICLYNFTVVGVMMLSRVMTMEGNYLDGLMTRKESLLSLLKAKYYFYTALLILPLLLSLPAVFMGKVTLLFLLACFLTASGPVYALLFQLAVYNNRTFPLDTQVTGRNTAPFSLQSLFAVLALALPMMLDGMLCYGCGETVGRIVLLAIGLLFTLMHPLWLRHVYERMMRKRYELLENYRKTR